MQIPGNSVSVIIPTLNEEIYISKILSDLEKQSLKPSEIIIVDGKSADDTLQKIRQFQSVKVFSIEKSTARQRNMGGTKAHGRYLIFIDADVSLSENFIKNSLKQFKKRKLDLACPFFIASSQSLFVRSVFVYFSFIFFLLQKISPSGAGTCFIIKSSVFKSTRGFSDKYKFEDMEYIRRVSSKYNFGIIHTKAYVSDRRFRKTGIFKTTLVYFILSFLFLFNQFKIANIIEYRFGNYNDR